MHFHSLTNISLRCSGSLSSGGGRTLTFPHRYQPSRFAGIGTPSRRLTLPSTGARRPLCLIVTGQPYPLRNLSSPLSPSSFAVMPSRRFIPSIDAASPLPQLRPFCCPATNGALGHLLTYKAIGRNSLLAMLAGETRSDGK